MKYVLIVVCRLAMSNRSIEVLGKALKEQGFYSFIIRASLIYDKDIQVFRLDDSLEQIDIDRIEKMCAEASK